MSEEVANLPSGADIAKACQTKGRAYRFRFNLPPEGVLLHVGKKIFVHGINPFGRAHSALNNSGTLKVPASKLIKLSALAQSGQDLLIAKGRSVLVDANVDIGKLIINGSLACPETGDFTIKTTGIVVSGEGAVLNCGTESRRFLGRLHLALKGGLFESIHGSKSSDRNVLVMNGGMLRLFGENRKAPWVRLGATAPAGADRLEMSSPVDWKSGEELAIAPSNYRPIEAERVQVREVVNEGRTVLLQQPLKFAHWGELQNYQGRVSWQVDERAEVAHLSRNIVVSSLGEVETMNAMGGHVMIMQGASAYVDGVEFFRMGRMGEMARYPFHWHRAGDVKGQFIRNSSVHESFQRCITVHGTMNAEVHNNVCFDHFGHGLFLEDGNETGNRITNNLVMLSKRPPKGRHLLESDINDASTSQDRFPGPASFWISHPQNTVTGNVAAGSQGTGFWMSFVREIACDAKRFCQKPDANHPATVFPAFSNTTEFSGNTAHSSPVGMTWDGVGDGELSQNPNNPLDRLLVTVHYGPAKPPEFKDLRIHKTTQAGIYYRGTTAYFSRLLLADNKVSLFFSCRPEIIFERK
jgi:cell migration-inducing and hyaluronan-binding protein